MEILRINSKGTLVKKLQEILNLLGFKLIIDGQFGKGTENAVKSFQSKNKILADGICGMKTWELLNKAVMALKPIVETVKTVKVQFDAGLEGHDMIAKDLLDLLLVAGKDSKNDIVFVTSLHRPPIRQANAMYNNLANGIVVSYAEPGKIVTKLIQDEIKKKTNPSTIVKMAEAKIIELAGQGKLVSRHCQTEAAYRKLNVIDVTKTRMKNYIEFVNSLLKSKKISRIITPFGTLANYNNDKRILVDKNESAVHIEYQVS